MSLVLKPDKMRYVVIIRHGQSNQNVLKDADNFLASDNEVDLTKLGVE